MNRLKKIFAPVACVAALAFTVGSLGLVFKGASERSTAEPLHSDHPQASLKRVTISFFQYERFRSGADVSTCYRLTIDPQKPCFANANDLPGKAAYDRLSAQLR